MTEINKTLMQETINNEFVELCKTAAVTRSALDPIEMYQSGRLSGILMCAWLTEVISMKEWDWLNAAALAAAEVGE